MGYFLDGIGRENLAKYKTPPSKEQIEALIKESGVSQSVFEIFFSIGKGVLRVVRCGARELPPRYWHIFYERLKPEASTRYTSTVIPRGATNAVTKAVSKPRRTSHKKDPKLAALISSTTAPKK